MFHACSFLALNTPYTFWIALALALLLFFLAIQRTANHFTNISKLIYWCLNLFRVRFNSIVQSNLDHFPRLSTVQIKNNVVVEEEK